jgi:hypothetical protein
MIVKCPPIDPALIRYLETVFPDAAVDPSKADPAVAYGSAKVIRHLKAVMASQEEEADVQA